MLEKVCGLKSRCQESFIFDLHLNEGLERLGSIMVILSFFLLAYLINDQVPYKFHANL